MRFGAPMSGADKLESSTQALVSTQSLRLWGKGENQARGWAVWSQPGALGQLLSWESMARGRRTGGRRRCAGGNHDSIPTIL